MFATSDRDGETGACAEFVGLSSVSFWEFHGTKERSALGRLPQIRELPELVVRRKPACLRAEIDITFVWNIVRTELALL
jgi:hypothetical protein